MCHKKHFVVVWSTAVYLMLDGRKHHAQNNAAAIYFSHTAVFV